MTEFVSEIKTIPYGEEQVYTVLSDLNNLERVKHKIPQDKVKDFGFDQDSIFFSISPFGKVHIAIVERTPFNTIKFEAQGLPVQANLWIQLKQTEENVTKLKVTVKANLNPFIKGVVSAPLKQGIEKLADVLAILPYDKVD